MELYSTVFFKVKLMNGNEVNLSGSVFLSDQELIDAIPNLVNFMASGFPMRQRIAIDTITTCVYLTSQGFPLNISSAYEIMSFSRKENIARIDEENFAKILNVYNSSIDIKRSIFEWKLGCAYEIISKKGEEKYESSWS